MSMKKYNLNVKLDEENVYSNEWTVKKSMCQN